MKKFFALICAGIIFFAGCGNEEAVQVKTEKILSAGEALTLSHDGKISLSHEVMIHSNVSGQVAEKYFKDGDDVTEGQKLFRIGKFESETELLKTKAALAESMTTLAREMAKKNPVGEIQAEIAERQERVKILEDELAAGMVYAPITGQSSVDGVHLGKEVKANETVLAKIGRSNPAVVRFEVPAAEKNFITSSNPKVSLKLSDGTTYPRAGTIKFLNDTTAEASFENPDGSLLLGKAVQVELDGVKIPNAVLVPENAIQKQDGENFVFVVDEDKNFVKKKISSVGKKGNQFIVIDGPKAGEAIVVDDALLNK